MPFNGTGTFLRLFNWTSDKNNGIPITASRFDSEDNDFAGGFDNCITRDGQGQPSNDVSWNNNKITNLTDATNPQDAVNLRTAQAIGSLLGRQVFTVTGTYTSNPRAKVVYVEVQGAGGGGGGCALTGAAECAAGGAGGGGGYASKVLTTGFTGGVTVTVGAGGAGGTPGANNGAAGGDSSFGALLTGVGGLGGTGSVASAVPQFVAPGAGGGSSGSGGLLLTGASGGPIINGSVAIVTTGAGGMPAGPFGPGAPPQTTVTGAAGFSCPNPGGGGTGCVNTESQGTAHSGGAGHGGIVIIWEFT